MKLYELELPEPPISDDSSMDSGIQAGNVYTYNPKTVMDSRGHPQHIFTVYSFKEKHTGKKSYALEGDYQIAVKVLSSDHLEDSTDKIQRVRIMSNVDQKVSRFSLIHEDFTRNPDGEKITFKLKELPDFDNYDLYTDAEFFTKFKRARLKEDHGLVGYIFVVDELESNDAPIAKRADVAPKVATPKKKDEEEDPDSKMDAARAIYRSAHQQGRKRVIHMFKTQLGITQNGASSYYTRIKNEMNK